MNLKPEQSGSKSAVRKVDPACRQGVRDLRSEVVQVAQGSQCEPTVWFQAEKRHVPPKNIITWLFEAVNFPANLALPKVTVGNKIFGGK